MGDEPRPCDCGWPPTYFEAWGMWGLRCQRCGTSSALAATREGARRLWDEGLVARYNADLEEMGGDR